MKYLNDALDHFCHLEQNVQRVHQQSEQNRYQGAPRCPGGGQNRSKGCPVEVTPERSWNKRSTWGKSQANGCKVGSWNRLSAGIVLVFIISSVIFDPLLVSQVPPSKLPKCHFFLRSLLLLPRRGSQPSELPKCYSLLCSRPYPGGVPRPRSCQSVATPPLSRWCSPPSK